MAVYTKRVQTVLTDKQFEKLMQLSTEMGKPVSHLIREAVDKVYFKEIDLKRRHAALERILSMDAPVSDWEQMEKEIIQGAIE